jgi:hypothetical protein
MTATESTTADSSEVLIELMAGLLEDTSDLIAAAIEITLDDQRVESARSSATGPRPGEPAGHRA